MHTNIGACIRPVTILTLSDLTITPELADITLFPFTGSKRNHGGLIDGVIALSNCLHAAAYMVERWSLQGIDQQNTCTCTCILTWHYGLTVNCQNPTSNRSCTNINNHVAEQWNIEDVHILQTTSVQIATRTLTKTMNLNSDNNEIVIYLYRNLTSI